MTPAQRALAQLEAWPDLTEGPAACGTGRALRTPRAEIVHFHTDHEVDLHLTGGAIRRIAADLRASTAIRLLPGSRWVTVRLDCEADQHLLMSLVSMALKAHQGPGPAGAPAQPLDGVPAQATAGRPGQEPTVRPPTPECNLRRVMLVPRDAPLG
ncbi:luciferase family protein [Streptomyces longwoodensis]|uniref:luciferase domain-containing protein n=1 Tax=Streptomyces longwoodensis TaxID=68231 RepID=UPI0033BB541C